MSSQIGLSRTRAALFVVDIQERLVPAMPEAIAAQVVKNTQILIEAAGRLGLPVIVSQQYPKGLGATLPAIETSLAGSKATLHRFDKTEFSGARTPEFAAIVGRSTGPRLDRDQFIATPQLATVDVERVVFKQNFHSATWRLSGGHLSRYQTGASSIAAPRPKKRWISSRPSAGLMRRASAKAARASCGRLSFCKAQADTTRAP